MEQEAAGSCFPTSSGVKDLGNASSRREGFGFQKRCFKDWINGSFGFIASRRMRTPFFHPPRQCPGIIDIATLFHLLDGTLPARRRYAIELCCHASLLHAEDTSCVTLAYTRQI